MTPVRVPARALAWWRALDGRAAPDDLLPAAVTVGLLAHALPAWTEHHVRTLDRWLAGADPGDDAGLVATAAVRALVTRGPAPEAATTAVDRLLAEWPRDIRGGARAALALLLHDRAHGTAWHAPAFAPWWSSARDAVAPADAAEVALLVAPAAPEDAHRLLASAPAPGGAGRLLARDRGERPPPADDDAWSTAADVGGTGGWTALCAGPLPACPQVVGVDVERVVLARAAWWRDGLYLSLVPADGATGTTEFRVVGAEPRIWFQSGIDGATTDTTSHGMVVRTPLMAGDLEFTPGSY